MFYFARGAAMRQGAMRNAVLAFALSASAHSADAHGIAGNRFFVGTLTFDDPSVADEAIVPNFSTFNHAVEGGSAVDNRFDWSFHAAANAGSSGPSRQWMDTPELANSADLRVCDNRYRYQKRNLSQQSARNARIRGAAVGDRAFGRAGRRCKRAQLYSARSIFR